MSHEAVLPTYAEVTHFLHSENWKPVQSNSSFVLFQSPETIKDDNGDTIRVMLPAEPGFVDESQRLTTVLELLAAIKDVSLDTLLFTIKNQRSDILEQRILCPAVIAGIPLDLMTGVTYSLRKLIYYSACLTKKVSPYITSGKHPIGLECVKKCRFAHTFQGSFGIRIEMPLLFKTKGPTLTGLSTEPEEPFERRLMKRIYKGFEIATQGVVAGDDSLMSSSYTEGFNANMCEVMSDLFESLSSYNYSLGYRLLWSQEYAIAEDFINKRDFCFDPNVYKDYFASAAKSLRAVGESKRERITGKVIGLHCIVNTDNDNPDFQENHIILLFKSGNKKLQTQISLSQEDYKKACEAHVGGKTVQVTGILEKTKKTFQMTDVSAFTIM